MKKSNIALGMSIGFVFLAIISCFVDIPVQVIATLSLCSLLFTVAQTIQSFITEYDEEQRHKFDLFKTMGTFQLDEKWEMIYKKYWPIWTDGKKQKCIRLASNIVEILAFIVLLLGLIVPIKWFEYEWVGNLCTFLSFSFLFFSVWLVGVVRNRTEMWTELRMINLMLKEDNTSNAVGGNQ